MGFMNIDGIGRIEIAGDTPTEDENKAIIDAYMSGQFDEEEPVEPEPVISPQDAEVFEEPKTIPEGPLGIVPTGVRGSVRETVEEQTGLVQFAAEAGPSIAGAIVGAASGTPLGPLGVIGGGILGGLGGEVAAQETGIAPVSDVNLALSAAGPVIGPALGGGFKLLRRGGSFALSKAPFIRSARAINKMSAAVEEVESFGTQILAKQQGLMSKPAGELYDSVRKVGVLIPPNVTKGTVQAIDDMLLQLKPAKGFTEVKQAMKVLKDAQKSLLEDEVSLDTLVMVRSLVGRAAKRAASKGGVSEGAAKNVFASLDSDLNTVSKMAGLTGRQARIAKAATRRAKLQFAVEEMEGGIARYMKPAGDDAVEFNVNNFSKWLMDVTNPKHKKYNKNFVDALKDDLPEIKKRIGELTKVLKSSSPGGPGSLVVRGQSAGVGALIGGFIGGAPGAAMGGIAGASGPEMLVSILTTKAGSKALEYALNVGKGELNMKTWMLLGQIATRSAGQGKESEVPATLSEAL